MSGEPASSGSASGSGFFAGWRDEPVILLSNFAANAITYLPALTLPWTIGALIQRQGLSGSAAGLLAGLEMGGLAAVAAMCGLLVHRFDRLFIVLLGAAISLLTMIALALAPIDIVLVAMPLSGIGFGLCCAGGNAITASSHDPARLSARSWILMMPWQMLIWAAAPLIDRDWGIAGLFALQATGILAMLLLLLGLRLLSAGIRPSAATRPSTTHPRLALLPLALIILCTIAFWLRDATTWSLLERRAAELHADGATLSAALSMGTVIGLAGPAATIWIGLRFGRVWTIAGSQILAALVFMAIALVGSPTLYCFAFLFWSGASIFAWTYVIEMTIAFDPSGRLAAICSGIVFGASALGPLLGGFILDSGDPSALPAAIALLSVAAVGFALAAAHRITAAAPDSSDRTPA